MYGMIYQGRLKNKAKFILRLRIRYYICNSLKRAVFAQGKLQGLPVLKAF
jgi:hypothetical protein